MAIQITKMIMHGILNAVLYIALPLILFEVISMTGLMTFTQEFQMSVIIIGIVGVVFSMLRHAFPKDSSANRLVAFGATVYSGIYLFYIFGGFTPGVALGTYSINLPTIQVLLGLVVIAWLLLGSSGLRALKYLIEAVELRKKKEYRVKKKVKFSTFFKVLGTILSLVIFGYLGSVAYSGMNLGFNIHPGFALEHDLSLPDLSDDTINMTMTFDLNNQGLYALYDISINAELNTVVSANESALPVGVKVGGSLNNYLGTFHAFTNYMDNNVTLVIDPTYIVGFATTDATLELKLSFSTLYAAIFINLTLSINIPWTALI